LVLRDDFEPSSDVDALVELGREHAGCRFVGRN
jgi:predicted nucleotidyltransferase